MNFGNLDNVPLEGRNLYNIDDATFKRVLDGEISVSDVLEGAGDNGHGPTKAAEGDFPRRSGRVKPEPITYLPGLVEIVKDNGAPAFLMTDRGVYHQLEYEGRPGIPHADFTKLFGEPLEAGEVLGCQLDPPALIRELEEFVGQHTELPEELPPLILSLWTIQGYLQESFNVLPYLYLSGPYGSGKTRVLETLAAVAFRPLFTTVLTPAAIFRTAEAWKPTFLVDESHIGGNDGVDLQAVLNNRYKRGVATIRCKPKSFETQTFNVFGPTAIAGPSITRALATRSLSGVMAKTTKPLPRRVHAGWARALRVKLVALRLAFYGASLPEAPRLADGRLDELVSSLHSLLLLLDPSRDQEFREAAAGQIHRHTADERDCMEAELAEALAGLEPDAEGRISVAEVVEALGWNPEDRSNTIRAGNLLRRAVGLEPVRFRREGKQYSGYIWEAERVTRFITRYYPEKDCTIAQKGAFSQVNGGVQSLCNLDFQDCTEGEVAQGECAISGGVQSLVFKIAHENTPSEQGKYEGCAIVQSTSGIKTPTPESSREDPSPPGGDEPAEEDPDVVVLVEKPHRIELRPRCKTLVAELAGGIYPWEYLFSDPVLAATPLQEALYEGGWRLVVVSGDRCWTTPHEALGEAEIRPHGTLVPEHLWQELGRVAS